MYNLERRIGGDATAMDDHQALAAFAALGNDVRFEVWRVLCSSGGAGLSAGVLTERVGSPPSALSFHLRTMMEAGLLTQRRMSRNFIYTVDAETLAELGQFLQKMSVEPPTSPSVLPANVFVNGVPRPVSMQQVSDVANERECHVSS